MTTRTLTATSRMGVTRIGVTPRGGQLLPLKTREELRAALETVDVYAVEVPARFADKVLAIFKASLPDLFNSNFQHLRRVVKFDFLPKHIQSKFSLLPGVWEDVEFSSDESSDDELAENSEGQKIKRVVELRYVVTTKASAISVAGLLNLLAQNPPFINLNIKPQVFVVQVPALAPTSAEQATQWSQEFWPVSYRNTNPFGPHPSIVARNAAEIEPSVLKWLDLADTAGYHTSHAGVGENIGCVIVDASGKTDHQVIAAAGDCRWRSPWGSALPKEGPGNVMAHSVQRAIAMVAKKRLRAVEKNPETEPNATVYCDSPLTGVETKAFAKDNIPPNGYLCVDLDIYLSHEPCVMCSMAILHSRFRRCVIRRRMPKTGGLTAETDETNVEGGLSGGQPRPPGLGCGMFWRPLELNWKFLAWEFDDGKALGVDDTLQA